MRTISFHRNNHIPYISYLLRYPGPIPHSTEFEIFPIMPEDWSIVELRSRERRLWVSGWSIKRLVKRLVREGEARDLRHAIEIVSGRGRCSD